MYNSCKHSFKLVNLQRAFSLVKKTACEDTIFSLRKINKTLGSCGSKYSTAPRPDYSEEKKRRKLYDQIMDKVKEKWINAGKYSVFPWSIAGVETCVVVKGENFNVAFDMGYPVREAVSCQDVFISHGHIDHTSGIVHHSSRRNLYAMKKATYHMLPVLVSPTHNVAAAVAQSHGGEDNKFTELVLNPVTEKDTIQLRNGYFVRPFPTHHRAPSQGYIIYKQTKKLKPEYQGLPGPEIGKLAKEGVTIHDKVVTPEIAYTGDTTFEVFTSLTNPDLLKVKVLITEATYIDDDTDKQGHTSVEKARERGHCHLREFAMHEQLFSEIDHIVLVHISDKYTSNYIHRTMQQLIPESLIEKIHLGTYMKDNMG